MNAVDPAKKAIEDAKVLVDLEDIEVPVVPKVATASRDATGRDFADPRVHVGLAVRAVLVVQKARKEIKATEVAKEKKEILVAPVKLFADRKVVVVRVAREVLKGEEALREREAAMAKVFAGLEVPKVRKEILVAPVKPCAAPVDLAGKKDPKDRKETKAIAVARERRYAVLVVPKVHVVHVAPEAREDLKVREVAMAAMGRVFADREVPKDRKEIRAAPVSRFAAPVVRAGRKGLEVHAVLKGNEALREKTARTDAKAKEAPEVRAVLREREALRERTAQMGAKVREALAERTA